MKLSFFSIDLHKRFEGKYEEKIMQDIAIFVLSGVYQYPPYHHYLGGTRVLQKIAKKGGEFL